MIDDLVTRGVSEPYRMFTSRAEFRLSLRCDNADLRLTPKGIDIGCVGAERAASFEARSRELESLSGLLKSRKIGSREAEGFGLRLNRDGAPRSAFTILSYPHVAFEDLVRIWPELAHYARKTTAQVEIDAKYSVYLERQEMSANAIRREESIRLGADFDYGQIKGLSNEVRAKLTSARPESLSQAGRIEGVTPAALALLLAWVRRYGTERVNIGGLAG
jgi:tRNA uridine 5-carboxymethylaminomethyl modification enzyme